MRYLLALGACVALVTPKGALAQAAPTTAPAVVTICVFSEDEALRASVLGKYVAQRLQQLEAPLTAKMNAEEAEEGRYSFQDQGVRDPQVDPRVRALDVERAQQLQEIDDTRRKANLRLRAEMLPFVRPAYAQRNCSLLLDRSAVYGGYINANLDISPDVVRLMDAKITQFPVDLAP